jgi:hypothetical protein
MILKCTLSDHLLRILSELSNCVAPKLKLTRHIILKLSCLAARIYLNSVQTDLMKAKCRK